ncbi:MAG: ATP synthase F1 subunit delta [Clostridia bacterium]
MSLVDKRYAEAFLQVSVEQNQVKEHLEFLRKIYYLMRDNKDFRHALNNPKLEIKQKQEIANAVLGEQMPVMIVNFLKVLIESGRIGSYSSIAKQYRGLAYKHEKIQIIRIRSAFPLDETQIRAIGEKYREMYEASSVITEFEIDKTLLGGILVKVGDIVYDNSLAGRLNSLKKTLNWGEIYEA